MKLRRSISGLLAIAAFAIVAGCQTPYVTGVQSSIGATGTSSTTSVILAELPSKLTMAGTYDVQEGSLTVRLRNPAGEYPFDQTYAAGESGEIRVNLVPALGEWTILITSPGGAGHYNARLER